MLSKNGTPIAKCIKDIRPIGILPICNRIMEKAIKILIDSEFPQLFKCMGD